MRRKKINTQKMKERGGDEEMRRGEEERIREGTGAIPRGIELKRRKDKKTEEKTAERERERGMRGTNNETRW